MSSSSSSASGADPSSHHVTVHWFRKGLRLHDNPTLLEACKATKALYAVFILDPWFASPERVHANRYNFLLESLQDLDSSLRALGSRLHVVRGQPATVIPALIAAWGVTRITWEADTEPYALKRDAGVMSLCKAAGVEAVCLPGHTLYHPPDVIAACRRLKKPMHSDAVPVPTSYEPFVSLLQHSMPPPPRPYPAPVAQGKAGIQLPLPVPAAVPLGLDSDGCAGAGPGSTSASSSSSSSASAPSSTSSDPFAVPSTIANLNPAYQIDHITTPFKGLGGESHALKRLNHHMGRVQWLRKFEKPNTSPTALDPDTTALSPYLKFGCLGSRQFYWALMDALDAGGGRDKGSGCSQPPVSLLGQLYWREFFYCQSVAVPHFDRMVGNPICRQIGWSYDPKLLSSWENSQTGYPWIDAAMAQLRRDGWMHHLARHAVACFLTRGDLYQSWEAGARIFDKYLLDSDWALNNGNWQWLSASAYFYLYFRVYSPVAFPKKTDPNGDFIRKYLPQFKTFPKEFIYEPWKAPLSVQQKHGVVVGSTYPHRIVDHEVASKENMGRHAAAYEAHKQGPTSTQVAPIVAGLPVQADGIGATQVGSDPSSAQAYALRNQLSGVGEVPGVQAAGSGSGSSDAGRSSDGVARTAAATASASSAGAAAGTGSGGGATTITSLFSKQQQMQQQKAGGAASASSSSSSSSGATAGHSKKRLRSSSSSTTSPTTAPASASDHHHDPEAAFHSDLAGADDVVVVDDDDDGDADGASSRSTSTSKPVPAAVTGRSDAGSGSNGGSKKRK